MSSKKNKSKKPAPKSSGFSLRSPFVIVLIIVVLLAAAGGITAGVVMRSGSSGGSGSDDIKLPSYATSATAPKGAATAYKFALDHPEFLASVPCYCGCGVEANHRSNLDCFIKSRNGNDVSFDDHAAY